MKRKDYMGSKEDVVRLLNTNAVLGLSHKAARVRFGRTSLSDERAFYYAPKKTWSQLIAPCVSDFSFWLMLLTSGALAFFDHTRLSLLCFVFLLVNFVFSVTVSKVSSELESRLCFGFCPKVKVLREGKLFVTDCRYVVRGDVVLLSRGDVVPFDARLLTAEKLTVSVYCGHDASGKDCFVTREKDADARLDGRRDIPPEERVNTVTAGSRILSGSARAVVTETGSYTYIGALTGGLSLGRAEEKNSLVPTVLRWTKNIGIVLLLLSLPLTAFAYAFGDPRDLAISFLTVLSLSTAVFPGWIIALLDLSATRAIYRFVNRKGTSLGALLRTASVSERIASMDVLVLLGNPMLTDGSPRVIGVFSDGAFFAGGELKDPKCRTLTEKALLLLRKANESPTKLLDRENALRDRLRKELFEYAAFVEADTEMLDIRYRVGNYRAPMRENPIEALEYFDTSEEGLVPRVLCSSIGEDLLLRCTHLLENGKTIALTTEKRVAVREAIDVCTSRGGSIHCYAEKNADGMLVFLGFFAYAELISRGTREAFTAFSSVGIRPLLFLDGETEADRYFVRSAGAALSDTEIALASDFRREGKNITEGFGAYSAYLGFTREEIRTLIETLEGNGIRTGAVVIDDEDRVLLSYVSVPIACGDAALGRPHSEAKELSELPISGVRYGAEASEQTKTEADVLIPRASRQGGGLSAVFRTLSLGRRIEDQRRLLLKFLVLSFGISAGWLIPALFGLGDLYAAVSLSFVGLIGNLILGLTVLLGSARDDGGILIPQVELRKNSDVIRRGIYTASVGAFIGFVLSMLPLLLQLFGVTVSPLFSGVYRGATLILASAFGLLYVRFRERRRQTKGIPKGKT